MPQDYTTLMEHAWATDPAERPTAQQLVECLSHIAGSHIAALQAGAAAASGAAAAATHCAATAAPVSRKSAEELLSNPAKRQVQREQQQQKMLKAASMKSAAELPSRRLSLTVGDGEEPLDVGGYESDGSGSATANPSVARRPLSGSGVRSFFSKLTGNSSSNNIAGSGSKPGSRDHSRELPSVTPKEGGLSPLASGSGHAQWFV
jgi:hypothetical protein